MVGHRTLVGHARTTNTNVRLPLGLTRARHPRSSSNVNNALGKGLVEGNHGVTKTRDTAFIPQGLSKSLAQSNSRVFNTVVTIDLDVTGSGDRHIDT